MTECSSWSMFPKFLNQIVYLTLMIDCLSLFMSIKFLNQRIYLNYDILFIIVQVFKYLTSANLLETMI